jgi:hypothetical protein
MLLSRIGHPVELERLMPRNWDKYIFVIAAALSSHGAIAAERIYYFIDEQGVTHLSNIPVDARYRPAGAPIASAAISEDTGERPPPELEVVPPSGEDNAARIIDRVHPPLPPEDR